MDFHKKICKELCEKLASEDINNGNAFNDFFDEKVKAYSLNKRGKEENKNKELSVFNGTSGDKNVTGDKCLSKVFKSRADSKLDKEYKYADFKKDSKLGRKFGDMRGYIEYLEKLKSALKGLEKHKVIFSSIFMGVGTARYYKNAAKEIEKKLTDCKEIFENLKCFNAENLCIKLIVGEIGTERLDEFIEGKYEASGNKEFYINDKKFGEKHLLRKIYTALETKPKNYKFEASKVENDSEPLMKYIGYLNQLNDALLFLKKPTSLPAGAESIFFGDKTSEIYDKNIKILEKKINERQTKLGTILNQNGSKVPVITTRPRTQASEPTKRPSTSAVRVTRQSDVSEERNNQLYEFLSATKFGAFYTTILELYKDLSFKNKVLAANPEKNIECNELKMVKIFFEYLEGKLKNDLQVEIMNSDLFDTIEKCAKRTPEDIKKMCENQMKGTQSKEHPTFVVSSSEAKKVDEMNKLFLGISNFGNSCYLATAIQELYHFEPFRDKVLNSGAPIGLSPPKTDNIKELVAVKFFFKYLHRDINELIYNISREQMAQCLGFNYTQANSAKVRALIETKCRDQMRMLKNKELGEKGGNPKGPREVPDITVTPLGDNTDEGILVDASWAAWSDWGEAINKVSSSKREEYKSKISELSQMVINLYEDKKFKNIIDKVPENQFAPDSIGKTIKKLFGLIENKKLYGREGFSLIIKLNGKSLDGIKETVFEEISEIKAKSTTHSSKTSSKSPSEDGTKIVSGWQEWDGWEKAIDEIQETKKGEYVNNIINSSKIILALFKNSQFKSMIDEIGEDELNLKEGYKYLEAVKELFGLINKNRFYSKKGFELIENLGNDLTLNGFKKSVIEEINTLRGSKKSRGLSADSTVRTTISKGTIETVLEESFKAVTKENMAYRLPLKRNRFSVQFGDRSESGEKRKGLIVNETIDLTDLVNKGKLKIYVKKQELKKGTYQFNLVSASIGTGRHYYLYQKINGKWKEFNDREVTDKNWGEIEKNIKKQCEILTYELQS